MSYPFSPDDRQNLLTSANPSITGLNDTLEANKGIIPQLDPNRFLRGGASQEATAYSMFVKYIQHPVGTRKCRVPTRTMYLTYLKSAVTSRL